MESVPGYRAGKPVRLDERVEARLGIRERDGLEVLLERFRGGDAASSRERAQHELSILQKLAGPGIPEAIELTESAESAVLVLRRTSELSLEHWVQAQAEPADPRVAIELFSSLARTVGRAHAARWVLGDIGPAGILVDPSMGHAWLSRFDSARPLGSAAGDETPESSATLRGSLRYSSPEATGRMGRGVDTRSDLYSLGATLHFVLTGRAPFEGDPLALIHAHIARMPPSCSELRPEVPATLSRIVSKLLQKAPEDRYQTAYALERDLRECREQLQRTGSIHDDFPLGTADVPYRPSFSRRVYGRDAEIQLLRDAYTRSCRGIPGVITLQGAPGIGKSVLVNELREQLVETRGYLASGKFDQYRQELPYAAFVQALTSWAQQILTESDARLATWREELQRALGPIAGALVGLAPDLGLVLGDIEPVPFLGARETRARLSLAFRRLVRALATPEHPLVLFLDDLQWADTASREILRELLIEHRSGSLLVVAAYRDTELSPGHPLQMLLDDLELAGVSVRGSRLEGLSEEPCARMLADALGRDPQATLPLARCIARKTGSSPLLIQQFVHHMYDLGLIRFEAPDGWSWDVEAIASSDVPEGAVALLTAKISRLSRAAATVLQLASCAGDEFTLETLARLCGSPAAELEPGLFTLSDDGLIAPSHGGFRFVHDRIREAAQSLLSAQERRQIHAQAARLLLERTLPDQLVSRAFELADHLNAAGEALDPTERRRALEVNLVAGKRALVSGAAATAVRYLGAARDLSADDLWEREPALCLDLFMQSVEAALQTRDAETALRLLDRVESHPLDRMPAAVAAAKRISAEATRRAPDEILPMVVAALSRFGVHWPAHPGRWRTRWRIWRTDWMLRGPLDAEDLQRRVDGDSSWMPAAMIMAAGGAAVSVASPALLCFLTAHWLGGALRQGVITPAMALASYASVRLGFGGSIAESARIAQAAEAWCLLRPDPTVTPKARYLLSAFIHSWQRSRRGVLEPLRLSAEQLFEVGDTEYGFFAMVWRVNFLASIGEPLDRVLQEQDALAERIGGSFALPERLKARALRLLTTGAPEGTSLDTEIGAIDSSLRECDAASMGAAAIWGMVLAVLGRWNEALQMRETSRGGSSYATDLYFYRGLAAGALAPSAKRTHARKCRRALRSALRRATILARSSSEHEHVRLGLEAETARLRARTHSALTSYARGIEAATKLGYRHHAALLHERRADLLDSMRRGVEGALARMSAAELYREWNARTKLAELEATPGKLPRQTARSSR